MNKNTIFSDRKVNLVGTLGGGGGKEIFPSSFQKHWEKQKQI